MGFLFLGGIMRNYQGLRIINIFLLFAIMVLICGSHLIIYAQTEPIEVDSLLSPATPKMLIKPLRAPALGLGIEKTPEEVIELPLLEMLKILEEDESNTNMLSRVAVHRPIDNLPKEKWRSITGLGGESSKRIIIHSPGATFIRPHFLPFTTASIEIYLYGESREETLEGPITLEELINWGFWGPPIEGEYLYIECISNSKESPPEIQIIEISHGYRDILNGNNKDFTEWNDLESYWCYADVSCYGSWSNKSTGVAGMYFETGSGGFFCSGALLNDTDDSTIRNWFLTANHCISDDSVANTLVTVFNYKTSYCGGPVPRNYNRVLGSDFVVGSAVSDYTLLELDENPPGRNLYSGWTTKDLTYAQDITTIHHPDGSYQRISFGDVLYNYTNFWDVVFHTSAAEGGSSGAPLYDNSEQRIRGQLAAGLVNSGNCGDTYKIVRVGKFGVSYYNGLSAYLNPPGGTPGDHDYCTLYGPCSAGEGDCDGNAQCQSGLTCVNDVGANYGYDAIVDVCEGTGTTESTTTTTTTTTSVTTTTMNDR